MVSFMEIIDMSQYTPDKYVTIHSINVDQFPYTAKLSVQKYTTDVLLLPYSVSYLKNNTKIVVTSSCLQRIENSEYLTVLGARDIQDGDVELDVSRVAVTPDGLLNKRKHEVIENFVSISEIGTCAGKPKIKGKVVYKQDKPYKNGTMCKIRIEDDTGNIGITAWDDTFAQFNQIIELNHTYTFHNIQIKKANPTYETKHTHELVLKSHTIVTEC